MINNDLTLLIMSCDYFSDLWDGQIKQLNLNWIDHPKKVYIVSDKPTNIKYENIDIIYPDKELEWSERLKWALEKVKTKYVFFTLDDYFLINNVKNETINSYVNFMKEYDFHYVSLRKTRKKRTCDYISNIHKLRMLDLENNYAINLYSGIWNLDFMKYCANSKKDVWRFEVSLTNCGKKYSANCAVCMDNKVYPILDVVRKGKLLRHASHYFKSHPNIYSGSRMVNDFGYEFKLNIIEFGTQYAPNFIINFCRNLMIKRGHSYFSQDSYKE